MDEKQLAEMAAELRREYKRRWNAANREKVKEHLRRYWERRVLREMEAQNGADTRNITKPYIMRIKVYDIHKQMFKFCAAEQFSHDKMAPFLHHN